MIRCACSDPDCKAQIILASNLLLFTDDRGCKTTLFLNTNTTIKLVKELLDTLAKPQPKADTRKAD